MDDSPETVLKKLCCTCLSKDRKLFQLCRLPEGVNNLYWLLSYDSEAYREGFYKDTASLFICWECQAIVCRMSRFRQQACTAQRQLTSIADGQTDIHTQHTCLSHLSTYHTSKYQSVIIESNESIKPNDAAHDNFIDCGPITDIKTESDEDVPLSELHTNRLCDNEIREPVECKEEIVNLSPDFKEDMLYKVKCKKKCKKKMRIFSTISVNDDELEKIRFNMKIEPSFLEADFKCENCIKWFRSQVELDEHNSSLHEEKPNHIQCDICLAYTTVTSSQDHRDAHYHKHMCHLCAFTSNSLKDMLVHLSGHAMKKHVRPVNRKKSQRKATEEITKPGTEPCENTITTDKRKPFAYTCNECNKYFENKNQRWKHVQRYHREGYKCVTCSKRFAFKNDLARHEQRHQGPPPREECPVCHKMIRVDLVKVHARIHAERQRFSCMECSKCFISRASYEHHLKYTQAHAQNDILKYKCSVCDKGYRSRGELRDHVNYQHMSKTQHKCPVCGKALATRRCITRHVRRAHDGVKESARDKICQQCGKAFRDKKGLREHELIHTGERPLSCEICGCTFRQSASLYNHRKRVHKIYPSTKTVTLLEQAS